MSRDERRIRQICSHLQPRSQDSSNIAMNDADSKRQGKVFEITRYDELTKLFANTKTLSSKRNFIHHLGNESSKYPLLSSLLPRALIFLDNPVHGDTRRVYKQYFSDKRIEEFAPNIEKIADELIAKLRTKQKNNEAVDIMFEYAFPIPCVTLASIVGFPLEDVPKLKEWTNVLIAFLGTKGNFEEKSAATEKALQELHAYINVMIKNAHEKKKIVKDSFFEALLEKYGNNTDEVIGQMVSILMAGHETTTSFIANGILTLIQHPQELNKLVENPSLLNNALEEILRYNGSTARVARTVTGEVSLPEKREIGAGDQLLLNIYESNFDDKVFKNPNVFDITRPNANKHLTFGQGAHVCIGRTLAKLEGRIAIGKFFQEFPNAKLVPGFQPRWVESRTFRVLENVMVTLS